MEVKFITQPEVRLAYYDPTNDDNAGKYAYIIMNGCNIPNYLDHQLWWENIGKRAVMTQVTSLRNDRLKEIKWAYFGKNNVGIVIVIEMALTIIILKALFKEIGK